MMTIFRYSTRAVVYQREALFPVVLAGLLGLWALIAVALASHPKLATVEAEAQSRPAYVSCQPAGSQAHRAPGQLLRCTIEPGTAAAKEI